MACTAAPTPNQGKGRGRQGLGGGDGVPQTNKHLDVLPHCVQVALTHLGTKVREGDEVVVGQGHIVLLPPVAPPRVQARLGPVVMQHHSQAFYQGRHDVRVGQGG